MAAVQYCGIGYSSKSNARTAHCERVGRPTKASLAVG